MIIELTAVEQWLAEYIGQQRSSAARGANVRDAKMGQQDGVEADIMGMKAELAAARHFGVYPDLTIGPRSGTADGTTRRGFHYDVKSTACTHGRLLCTLKDNPDIDFYVLAIVTGSTVDLAGWAWKWELRQEARLADLGHGTGYAIPQPELRAVRA